MFRQSLLVLTTGALVLLGSPAAQARDDDHGNGRGGRQTVEVVGDGTSVRIDRSSVGAGTVRFRVSSTRAEGSEVTLFRLRGGVSLDDFFADLKDEFTPDKAANATKELRRDASFYGLAEVVKDHPETITERVDRGTYYLMDLGNVDPSKTRPEVTKLTVRGGNGGRDVDSDLSVRTVNDRFVAPRVWPHRGTYSFTNRDDTIHFMAITPVKAGTTDRDIQDFFDHPPSNPNAQPPFFRDGPSGGNDVVSPGRTIKVSYDLPAGTYVLLCFVADEETGMPHAFMGMHRVVRLR